MSSGNWNEDDEQKSGGGDTGGGSVWTSFSDLFTSLAVIFLIMFVVGILKMGITSIEKAKSEREQKAFLEGKVPDAERKKSEEKKKDLKVALNNIEKYKHTINERTQELNQMVAGLSRHEKIVENLLKEQNQKDAVLANINSVILKKNQELEEKKKQIQLLANQINQKDEVLRKKQREVENQLQVLNQKIQVKESELKKVQAEANQKVQAFQNRDDRNQERINKLQGMINQQKRDLVNLQGAISQKHARNNPEKVSQLKAEISALENTIAELKNNQGRGPASSENLSLRKQIASNVADRLKGMKINVETNLKTGSITLFMDEAFLFQNDSFVMSEEVKEKLKLIVPVYTEELFRVSQYRDNISSVNVIGHASPRFSGRFVDPKESFIEAYYHNLKLSSLRALQIAQFMVGDQIGSFTFKGLLQEKLKASGKGYTEPIKKQQNEISKKDCGPYSCLKSRRVEISFSLKEQRAKAKVSIDDRLKKKKEEQQEQISVQANDEARENPKRDIASPEIESIQQDKNAQFESPTKEESLKETVEKGKSPIDSNNDLEQSEGN